MANFEQRSSRNSPRTIVLLWQRSPAVRWGALAIVLGCYATASLEPFDWQLPKQLPNRAERVPDGWRFAAPGIVVAEPPHEWLEAATAAETLRLSLEVRPFSAAQSGPARIVTISRDRHLRNLTVAQEADDLILRLRAADTDLNGLFRRTTVRPPQARLSRRRMGGDRSARGSLRSPSTANPH
jgi:hypothetical protein